MINNLKIKDDLFLISQKIQKDSINTKTTTVKTHHLFIIDCSGSMYDDLPKIKRDLYNKISTDLKQEDSLTIIWFSGRGECGVIVEDYHLKSVISLGKVKELIEKYLTPIGLTSFKDPFENALESIKRVLKNNPDMIHSLFFITDGHDNQYSTKEILSAVSAIKEHVDSSTIVEYGWYCNRDLLSKIACEIGGVHIFSEDFQDYEPYIQKEFSNQKTSKRKYVKIEGDVSYNVVFNITEDGEVINYSVNEKNEVFIGENDENIYFFSKYPSGQSVNIDMHLVSEGFDIVNHSDIVSALYASLFSFSRINDYNTVSDILKFLGDARFIVQKANTFGTQKINELENKFLGAITDVNKRFVLGYNPNLEPAEDAYCVLDMIQDLMDNEENMWYPNHDAFKYKRIGAKVVEKTEMTEKEKKDLTKLLEGGQIDELKDKLDKVSNRKSLIFEYKNEDAGCSITDLVWNEKRANLSVRVAYSGQVQLPEHNFATLSNSFETTKWRNYTLIKDGIIHTYKLPVSLSKETFDKLQLNGLLMGEFFQQGKIYVLDFSKLPVINRKMVETMSAEELFRNEYELLKLKAKNTVFNHYKKSVIGEISFGFIEKFGEQATEWLKELGLTPSGFNPPSVLEKTGEEVLVNSLKVKINKLTLMTAAKDFEKVLEKRKNGEALTPREELLVPGIEEFESFMKLMSDVNDTKMVESWLDQKSKAFRKRKNELMNQISKSKFLCVVGKSWFKEFSSRDEKEMILNIDGMDIKFELDDKMEVVKI